MAMFYNESNNDKISRIKRCENCGRILTKNVSTYTGYLNCINNYGKVPVIENGIVIYCYICPQCNHRNF